MKKYLIINTGSTSKKYAFYNGENKVYNAHFELEKDNITLSESIGERSEKKTFKKNDY